MRKVFVVVLIMVLMLSTTAFARGRRSCVDNDSYVDRYSEYEQGAEVGLMADVTLYKDSVLDIPYTAGVQSQYDFNNKNWGFYGKVSLDLSSKIKELIGKIGK